MPRATIVRSRGDRRAPAWTVGIFHRRVVSVCSGLLTPSTWTLTPGGAQHDPEGLGGDGLVDLLFELPAGHAADVEIDVFGVANAGEEVAQVRAALEDVAPRIQSGAEDREEPEMEVLDRLAGSQRHAPGMRVIDAYGNEVSPKATLAPWRTSSRRPPRDPAARATEPGLHAPDDWPAGAFRLR